MTGSPAFRRMAVTVPPEEWFHGICHAIYRLYRAGLENLGCDIFDVPVLPFLTGDAARIADLVNDLRLFRPEAAMGLHKGSLALICRMPPGEDGWRPNVFADILDIPVICLWDHAPLELANQLLQPYADGDDALRQLSASLAHPRLIHWSPDSGQTRLMRALSLTGACPIIHEGLPVLPGFAPDASAAVKPGIGFVGHVYQEAVQYSSPALENVAANCIRQWLNSDGQPFWHFLANALPETGMTLNQTCVWKFAHRLTLHTAQTARRLRVLGSAAVPVTCYGDLRAGPEVPANLVPVAADVPFGPELARVLAAHEIAIDVINPGAIDGYSSKPLLAFAAGGFMLVDRKSDFVGAFGQAGEAISYTADLAAKIDHFLSRPGARREVGDDIRNTIRSRFRLEDVLGRVLQKAREAVSVRRLQPVRSRCY